MENLIKLLLQLTVEIKNMKELLNKINKSRYDSLKEAWLDTTEVMNILRISLRTLGNLRQKGILPFTKIGGKTYFKLSDVERILEFHNTSLKKDHGTK